MSRSFWAAAITVLVMSLVPGVALAANSTSSRSPRASALHKPKQPRVERVVVLELGSGVSLPGGAAGVRSLQRQLVRMGFSPGPIDGRYGPLTTQAVAGFQRAHGLVADGIVGPETRKALAGGSLVSGAGYLQPGGSPAVRSLQRRLSRAGFSPGPGDGRYGPLTAQAVRQFQHAHRLAADGIAGVLTLHALGSHHPKESVPRRHTARRPRHHAAPRPPRHTNPTTPKPQTTPAAPKPRTAPAQRAHGSSWLKWVIFAVLTAIAIAIAVFVLVGPDRRPRPAAGEDVKAAPQDAAAPSAAADVAPIATGAAAASVAASRAAADPIRAPEEATPEPPPVQATPAPVSADARPAADEARSRSEDPLPALEEAMLEGESAVAASAEVHAERAELVQALQRQLSWLGLEPGPVDGRYGPVTTEAVKRFQEANDLPVAGVVDPETLGALRKSAPQPAPGRRVERVKELQRQLASLGLSPGPVDGRYGPATTGAVKRFQEANDLPVHGVADRLTLSALRAHVRGRPFTGRLERVKELQRHLTALGLEPGPVDGRYGPATTDAVRRLQQRHRLPMDGIADPDTLNALHKDIAQTPQQTPDRKRSQSQERAAAASRRADQLGHGGGACDLGVLLGQRGDLAAAEDCFRRADQRGIPAGAFNLGVLLEEQGDHLGALRAYERAERLGDSGTAEMARAAALRLRSQIESPTAATEEGGHDGP